MDTAIINNANVAPAPRARARPLPRRVEGLRTYRVLTVLVIFGGLIFLVTRTPPERAVLTPVFLIISIAMVFVGVLFSRDGRLPIFDPGTMFIMATVVYSTVPLIQFWLAGLAFTLYSDFRFWVAQPTAEELGGFAWRHVTLVATFSVTYLLCRGSGRNMAPVHPPNALTGVAIAIPLIATFVFFGALHAYVGPVVSIYAGGAGEEYQALPYVLQQVTHILTLVRFTLKQWMLVFLMTQKSFRWRLVAYIWLAVEVVGTAISLEARTMGALLVLTAIVVYHRVVRPLKPMYAFGVAAALLSGLLVFGVARDFRSTPEERKLMYSMTNEFQGLFANAYDLRQRKINNRLPPVPPQLHFSDLYMLVPSQLLPFTKVNPSTWYQDVVGTRKTGFVFGLLAQSVISFDWPDLVVRAALLAMFYAFVHRFYRRRAASFWNTVLHLFILSWAYYAYRSTTFDIFYKLIYYFLPTLAMVLLIRLLLTRPVAIARRVVRSQRAP